MSTNRFRKTLYPYLYMVPVIVLVLSVCFLPLVQAIRVSLFETDYLKLKSFIGFQNYLDILASSDGLRNILNSLIHVCGTLVLSVPTGLILSLMLNQEFRLMSVRTIFRAVLVLPYAISWMITAFLWLWLLNPYYGPISYIIKEYFNLALPDLSTSPVTAMPLLIFATSWRLYPLALLFIIASLQTIPDELYEAAKMDGVTTWQSFRFVTFPLIKNTILVVLVLLSLNVFNHVTLTLMLTGGGPSGITETLAFRTFKEGIVFWRTGYASAQGVIIFLFNIGLSLVYVRTLMTERYY